MQVRHMRLEVFVNIAREFLWARSRPDTRLFGIEAQLLIVFCNGFRRIVGLDERHRPIAPQLICGAEHIGILHAGNAQERLANLFRIDVLTTGNDEIFHALIHIELAIAPHASAIARHEVAIHAHCSTCVQITREHPRAFYLKLADPLLVGLNDVNEIARQHAQATIEPARDGRTSDHGGRLGHAVARENARPSAKRLLDGLLIERSATQQDAFILRDDTVVVVGEQVLQDLVDHGDVRNLET